MHDCVSRLSVYLAISRARRDYPMASLEPLASESTPEGPLNDRSVFSQTIRATPRRLIMEKWIGIPQ